MRHRPDRPRSKVVCTLACGPHRELLELTRPSLERYAHVHGYDVVVAEHRAALERPASWSKIPMLHDLAQRYDVVLWVDADAMIVDDERDIVDDLRSGRCVNVVEHRIGAARIPNLGVVALRRSRLTTRFLERVWDHREFTHHRWWENGAALHVLGYRAKAPVAPVRLSPWRAVTGYLDVAWNSVPAHSSDRPRIVHLSGLSHHERLTALRALAG